MSDALLGYNATFGIEGGTPGTYVLVAEVTSITPPGQTRDTSEVTHLKSPDKYKEFIANLADGGDASISVNFVPSATDVLLAAFDAESGNYQITFPNGVKMNFAGIITGWEIGEIVPNEAMTASFTVKQTGSPTLVAAS